MHPMPQTQRRPPNRLDRHRPLPPPLVLPRRAGKNRLAGRPARLRRVLRQPGPPPGVLRDVRVAADVAERGERGGTGGRDGERGRGGVGGGGGGGAGEGERGALLVRESDRGGDGFGGREEV